ncbi:esterase-like activity of phytase family protein [Xanthobacter sp. VTT E-85241]|uniref:esterase-like activity of phytase family protein n=1 Tax=Roseixanthobacter finlandensis TaxID=3119922 RepID=UPI00372A2CBF
MARDTAARGGDARESLRDIGARDAGAREDARDVRAPKGSPRARWLAGLALAALIATGLAGHALSEPPSLPVEPVAIEVQATPLPTFHPRKDDTRFGALLYRGGLRLTSPFPGFGGLSAFHLDADGAHFLAVTDAGLFLRGRLVTEGDRPIGLADVTAAAILDQTGAPLADNNRGDAESLAFGPKDVFVGLEDVNEIWSYPGADPLEQKGKPIPVPPGVKALRDNLGLESLVYVPSGPLAGALLGIGEVGATNGADLPGFIIGGPKPGTFTIPKSGVFSATDVALGPDGELFLLERHYAVSTGVSMQIRRFQLKDVAPGAVLKGDILFTADMGYEIDNMEGLAVTVNAAGETLLTLISDDNFSPIQRTILLRFALAKD